MNHVFFREPEKDLFDQIERKETRVVTSVTNCQKQNFYYKNPLDRLLDLRVFNWLQFSLNVRLYIGFIYYFASVV